MRLRRDTFLLALFALGYLAILLFATWDRPEAAALGGILIGCSFILIAGLGRVLKCGSLRLLDFLVLLLMGYLLWRAENSAVVMYARFDQLLVLLAGGVWMLRHYLGQGQELARKGWLVCMLVALVGNLTASWHQLFTDNHWGLFIQRSENASQYVSGFFSHYNYMANFCMLAVFSSLAGVFRSSESRFWRVLAVVVLLGNAVLLVCSHSRGAFVASAAGVFAFGLLTILAAKRECLITSSRLKVSLGLGLFGSLIGGVLWIAHLNETRGWLTASNDVADNGRGEVHALAVDQFLQSPIIGEGARSFEWKSIDLWPDDLWQGSATLDYVHHEYLQVLAEYGSVGLGLVLAVIVSFLWVQLSSVLTVRKALSDHMWQLATVAAVLAFATQSFFSFVGHIPALLLSVTVVAVLGCDQKYREGSFRGSGLIQSIVLFLAGLVMLGFSVKELPAFVLHTHFNETHEVDVSQGIVDIQKDIVALAHVVERAPNHERLERLGLMAADVYQQSSDADERLQYLEQSVSAFQKAVELYPQSPFLQLNYARVLAWSDRYNEAETHFEYAIRPGKKREYKTNAHKYYAEYCFERGNELWFERKTGEAYYYFLESRKLIENSIVYRLPKGMVKLLNQRIDLLESAGFVPVDPSKTSLINES